MTVDIAHLRALSAAYDEAFAEFRAMKVWPGFGPDIDDLHDVLMAAWEALSVAACNALPGLLDKVERLRAVLGDIEWVGDAGHEYNRSTCPMCEGSEPKHAFGCELKEALR
ncbi:MAG: hypothetical protein NUW01_18900 [Gemmatimonadaceae bacterium]|nr:hypothetical protein [Gemmatimonadaceae bacterium]